MDDSPETPEAPSTDSDLDAPDFAANPGDYVSPYVDLTITAEISTVETRANPLDADDYMLPIPMVGDRSWMVRARCRIEKMPTAEFYVSRQRTLDVLPLRLFCRACPVRWECLDFAISNGDRYGVWGGYVDKERRKIRRRMEEAGITLQEAANLIRNLDAIPASRRKNTREGG